MTTTELGASWSERLNPRNWSLAWKLIAIGLVPALLALALGVLRIADQAGDAAALGTSNRLLDVRGQVAEASDALRQERDEATLFVAAGRTEDRGVLDIGIGQTDADVQEAVDAVAGTEGFDNTTSTAFGETQNALGQLSALRGDVATGTTPAAAVQQSYTDVISRVDGLERALLRQLRTPDVAGLADALTATTSASEQLAVQHTALGAAIRAGQLLPEDAATAAAADSRLTSAYTSYAVALTPEQLARFGTLDSGTAELQAVKGEILATEENRPVVVDPARWDAAYATALTAVQTPATVIRDDMVAQSTAAEERASNLAGINSVILMLGLLLGITIAILVARALVRSLRVLRTAALDVAERRLPQAVESMRAGDAPDVTVDPVPLDTRDEVGQVARAFDAVHGQAIRLAADQAALQTNVSSMFVNLSRRSQALVERQLQLIEQLESNEQDPDQLSNLFQLDHLATRMRRNSENLLVLAGTDLAKRNIAPVPMVDVLRAAVSEIEQYQRIVVQAPPTTSIVGRAASDLVHLLAELLDNATNFSPPDSQVVMSTTRTAEGDILVEIADRGVGMIDYELADANQRLGGPSSVDVSASRRMGLFVVGRLGARHGVQVQLSTSSAGGAGTGLTASVTVPAHLVPTAERELARPVPAIAQGGGGSTAFDVPPQRAANGSGRTGSLSALVTGSDGPATPATAFDPGPGGYPQVNGASAPPVLPTRRPGSSLGPEGPPSPGEQARQDQLAAAERSAAERVSLDKDGGAGPPPTGPDSDDRGPVDGDAADLDRTDAEAADGDHDDTETTAYPVVPPRSEQPAAPERARHAFAGDTDDEPEDDAAPEDAAPAHALIEPADEDRAETAADETAGDASADDAADDDDSDHSTRGPGLGAAALGAAALGAAALGAAAATRGSDDGQTPASGSMPRNPWPQGDPPHLPAPSTNGNGVAPTGNGAAPAAPPALPQRRPSPVRPAAAAPPPAGSETDTSVFATRGDEQAGATAPEQGVFGQSASEQGVFGQSASEQGAPEQVAPSTAPIPAVAQAPAEAAAPATGPDELFAPSVPADRADAPPAPAVEPPAPAPAAPAASGRPEGSGFELGETTPIFEEIASAWFRSNRPLPVDWEAEARSAGSAADSRPRPASALPPAAPQRPHPLARPAGGPLAGPPSLPPAAPQQAPRQPMTQQPMTQQPMTAAPQAPVPQAPQPQVAASPTVPPATPPRPAPVAPPAPVEPAPPTASAAESSGFSSAADEGWRAANNVAPATDRPDEVTAAGLPKRRPRARLVPGSAGSAVLAPPVSPARSAESVRGRLASYQQGVRQGRESRFRADGDNGATESANAGGNHDEERP
ncbi:nitrate- and nitrite sensing domain-containing protein [Pseudonocardia sp. KRD-184]|uniref:histidine kinase n=1 Tax=Pseudonocardia oceani TaxID=2792013 RepID=A0ABS6U7S2_9PSEU|nr:nitrate- and nitrite sensing domain-containing protein [Pseudonocardia oceani]MBW0091423.1 nitrate- and nitrite sensing domain-containing protein [Pseudonocardia oceani]MBW0098851.1 nitrate- and nitrite sensing domain-containing protein [Pseudonocardia oceani]MBW0111058.1 nitrate- and nitrite sensing domain-containing protein [Pseudonocardia oceani]MBW0123104.1 nitrate- and nitrite sensing domain-containing protein [Pseudonocardia oceani]MBW0128295.1 nitrate- and nitrite sensing domain-cont